MTPQQEKLRKMKRLADLTIGKEVAVATEFNKIDTRIDKVEEKIEDIKTQIPDVKKALDRVEALVDGEKGEQGERGEKGDKGDAGKDGRDGKDGKNGKDGVNGKDGRDGKDGKDGVDGKDGADGFVDEATIGYLEEKMDSLADKIEEKLKSVPTKSQLPHAVGIVVREVQAGTGVTIDNSNPLKPIINATATSGGYSLTVSDTDPSGTATDGDVHLLTDDGTTGGVVIKTFVYDGAWIDTTEPDYEKCKNVTGSTIAKGKIVYVNGANGSVPTITLADNTTEATSSKTIGITAKSITNNSDGYFIRSGLLLGIDTSSFSAGDTLWLGTSGNLTNTRPTAPNHAVFVGYALTSSANGRILVSIMNGYELGELHDVSFTSLANDDFVQRKAGLWVNRTIAQVQSDIGLSNKADKIGTDDIEITDATKGVIIKSANGTRWRLGITNSGELTATSL